MAEDVEYAARGNSSSSVRPAAQRDSVGRTPRCDVCNESSLSPSILEPRKCGWLTMGSNRASQALLLLSAADCGMCLLGGRKTHFSADLTTSVVGMAD